MRRRAIYSNNKSDVKYPLENGTFTSLDGTTVIVSNGNHIYAKSGGTGGAYYAWLFPKTSDWYTSINNINMNQIYPSDVLFSLKNGDIVKFVITNNNTSITNRWQALRVGFANEIEEKVASGEFQQKTELTTEVIVTEDIDVTAFLVRIGRYDTEAEFDLEVYVNDVRYF